MAENKTVKAVSFTDSGLARAKGYSYKVKAVKNLAEKNTFRLATQRL